MRTILILFTLSLLGLDPSSFAQTPSPPATMTSDTVDLATTHRVTLHLKSALPDAAVSAFSARAGLPMLLMLPNAGPFLPHFPVWASDFDVVDEPMVTAMLRLCAVYDLEQSKMSGEDAIMFVKRAPMANRFAASRPSAAMTRIPPTCITGPFAVVAEELIAERWADPIPAPGATAAGDVALPQIQSSLQLRMRILSEPRVSILSMAGEPVINKMLDDQGEPLWEPPQGGPVGLQQLDDTNTGSFLLTLRPPLAGATRITSFSGSVRLHVVTRSHRYEWINLDRTGERTEIVDGHRINFDALQDDAGTPTQITTIRIDFSGIDPREWEEKQYLIGRGSHIQIFDKSGNLLSRPFTWYPFSPGMFLQMELPKGGLDKNAGPVGRAYRMVWDFPLEAGDVEVPFSFTDLPLPVSAP